MHTSRITKSQDPSSTRRPFFGRRFVGLLTVFLSAAIFIPHLAKTSRDLTTVDYANTLIAASLNQSSVQDMLQTVLTYSDMASRALAVTNGGELRAPSLASSQGGAFVLMPETVASPEMPVATTPNNVVSPQLDALFVMAALVGLLVLTMSGLAMLSYRRDRKLDAVRRHLIRFTQSLKEGVTIDTVLAKGVLGKEISELQRVASLRTEQSKRMLEDAEKASRIDPRTGLLTLKALKDVMLMDFGGESRGSEVGLIVVEVNLSNTADAINSSLAQIVVESLRAAVADVDSVRFENAYFAKIGHNTFGIYLRKCENNAYVDRVVRSLDREFSHTKPHENGLVNFQIKAGIAASPLHAVCVSDLLDAAFLALHRCRQKRGISTLWFNIHMRREANARLTLDNKIREGIARDEFFPVFQPKISFKTGRIAGVEALARWDRPDGEFISPVTFIPAAERLGLIGELGNSIMKKSCIAAANWQGKGQDITVAVNVSPQQLNDEGFSDFVIETLLSTGLHPSKLEVEITESMAVRQPELVIRVMAPLREMGVRLAIDDFGTGHSNLATLAQLPFDVFKIDRAFVQDVQKTPQSAAICEMILRLATTLGMKTVAEGIETEEEAKFLRAHGADLAQGWLYSKGLGYQEFLDFADEWDIEKLAS